MATVGSAGGLRIQISVKPSNVIADTSDQLHARVRQIAQSAQAELVSDMEKSFLRPGASTGRLLRVTSAPENVDAEGSSLRGTDGRFTGWGFALGNAEFLDASVAKYWRTFEEGSAAAWSHPFTGTVLRGTWGDPGGWWATRTPGPQPQPLAGNGGSLRDAYVFSRQAARNRNSGPRADSKLFWNWYMQPRMVVGREIRPTHLYRTVAERYLDEFRRASEDQIRTMVRRAIQSGNTRAPGRGFRTLGGGPAPRLGHGY